LVAAHAGDPAGGAGERAAQWLDLADVAAGLARLDRITKGVDALAGDITFDAFLIGEETADAAAVALLGFRPMDDVRRLRILDDRFLQFA
jgi:hypothetical protein